MNSFDNVRFNGQFRDYQKRILDNADKYLVDGKINIVAAPGSGKTTLGLELIKRLGSPCLILSPTTTIKYQWGSRFEKSFIGADDNINDYFSYDLKDITLFNSITYQALYSSMKKIKCESDDETVDYSDIDLFRLISDNGIGTICLDEAHHLQNEWQKALETFISGLDRKIKIISLTATPPYDANKTEWDRYKSVCGDIDEEIFVPELVKEKTLCPHQDYIYFNYPTADELAGFRSYREKCLTAVDEIAGMQVLHNAYTKTLTYANDYDCLFSNSKNYIALLIYCQYSGMGIDKKLVRTLTTLKVLPKFNMEFAQTAIQFILDDESLVSEEERQTLREILKKHSVLEKGKVCLSLNDKLVKQLASSAGKLDSISKIVQAEWQNLETKLRMLILTDYIRKESISDIGTDHKLTNISIVSIFEIIRRNNPGLSVGAVSGSLILLPDAALTEDFSEKSTALPGTGYSVCNLNCSNKEKVEQISRLFESGKINVLIGTKSLLGEGWDSPCINSLILASFVGSFMLSNQMRGRAIRTDRNNPCKVSNIWHLVTLEPEYLFESDNFKQIGLYLEQDNSTISGNDFQTLTRRFECFVGPEYETGEVENGIDRISILKPPFDKTGISKINMQMLSKAADRSSVSSQWEGAVKNGSMLKIQSEIPKDKRIQAFTFFDVMSALTLFSMEMVLINAFIRGQGRLSRSGAGVGDILTYIAVMGIIGFLIIKIAIKIIINSNPHKAIKNIAKALLKTLQETDMISTSAILKTEEDKYKTFVGISLSRATVHEQNIFNTAITELLSPIDNPRYLLIMKHNGVKSYRNSYACPSVIDQHKEYVELFKEKLKERIDNFEIVYTRNENGRDLILHCRRKSYITQNAQMINKKKKVVNWE